MKKNWLIIIVLFLSMAMSVCVNASSNGIYLADATAYYAHPLTNEVEDAGNNSGIGQGMTESMLYRKALIEVDADGTIYTTTRYYLTDQIRDVKFWTQKSGASSWQSVKATVMQQNLNGKYCTDYRFVIPEENAIVRTSCYVDAMGREVIFYYTFSNLSKGSGDFVKSIQVTDTTQEQKEEQEQKPENNQEVGTVVSNEPAKEETVKEGNAVQNTQQNTEKNTEQKELSAVEQIELAEGLTTSMDAEENANDVEGTQKTEGKEMGAFSEVFLIVAAAILSGVLVGGILIVMIGVGAYFIIKRLKEREN